MLNTEHRTPNTEHRHWQTYALNLSNNAIRHVFTLFLLIPSTFWFKSSLKSLAKIALLALPLLSYSWQLQAANGNNNQVKRSDAIIIIPSPVIDYARPNLYPGDRYRDMELSSADVWRVGKGFFVQSTNSESYNLNFPTTGAHNLSFDLLITGIEPEELTWEPVTHEGITATVTNVVADARWMLFDEDRGKVVARVKLTGPEARNQWYNPNP
ncbi:hypothetical protein, partial [Gilliamella intestini]